MNLDNPSKKTVEIAEEQLARLCAALGLAQIEDSEELHDRPFIATVVIDKRDPTSNRIYDFKPAEGAAPAAAQTEITPLPPRLARPTRLRLLQQLPAAVSIARQACPVKLLRVQLAP